MPDISDSDLRLFLRYQNLGTPDEVSRKIEQLTEDNRKYRQEEKPALEAKLPKEGQVVVDKADADLLPKYKELGKPEELKTKVEESDTAKKRVVELETKQAAGTFAKAVGLAEEAVDTMTAIPQLSGAKYEVRKVKVKNEKGEEVEQDAGYITLSGEDQKAMSFKDALEKVPALKGLRMVEETKGPDGKPVGWVRQGPESKSGAQGGTVYDRIREQRKKQDEKSQQGTPEQTALEKQFGVRQTT